MINNLIKLVKLVILFRGFKIIYIMYYVFVKLMYIQSLRLSINKIMEANINKTGKDGGGGIENNRFICV